MKSHNVFLIITTLLFAIILSPLLLIAAEESPQKLLLKSLGCERALIVNGDDLGRSKHSNEGILKGLREGILTSTTLMTPALAADEAYQLIRENPGLDVGIHLVLARDDAPGNLYGPVSPLEKVKTLVDPDGYFFTCIDEVLRLGDRKEIGRELLAQVKVAYENGVDITHLDCHKGFYHTYDPKSLKATLKIAGKYNLPIRWVGSPADSKLKKKGIIVPKYITGVAMDTDHETKKKMLMNEIKKLKKGITEIYFHPATGGFTEKEASSRQSDLDIVMDPDIKNLIEKEGICLIGYKTLRDFQRELKEKNKTE